MAADSSAYLNNILIQKSASINANSPAAKAAYKIVPLMRAWGGIHIVSLELSGSYAKGTAVKGGTDIDLFISLSENLNMTLKNIYNNLHTFLKENGYPNARAQNVSVGIMIDGIRIDLVPAQRQNPTSQDHSLYRRKADTWTKTNIQRHIQVISQSKRLSEIRAMKLWRNHKGLNFPSFLLELSVIEALRHSSYIGNGGDLSENIVTVLNYLKTTFKTANIIDPANTNNIISDDLTPAEKNSISQAAEAALKGTWGNFIS